MGNSSADGYEGCALLRRFREQDRLPVARLLGSMDLWRRLGYGEADWERFLIHRRCLHPGFIIQVPSMVAEVAGVALLGRSGLPGLSLDLLAIMPSLQGKGLGTLALDSVERHVFRSVKHLFVSVSAFNDQARRFYRRRGYRELGPVPVTPSGFTEILLCKSVWGCQVRGRETAHRGSGRS